MLKPPKIYENDGVTKIMYPNEARLRNFTYSSIMAWLLTFCQKGGNFA